MQASKEAGEAKDPHSEVALTVRLGTGFLFPSPRTLSPTPKTALKAGELVCLLHASGPEV